VKAVLALLLTLALGWVALPGLPACPVPTGDPPPRLALVEEDHSLHLHRWDGFGYAESGLRRGVLQVESAWGGWLAVEQGRLVRVDDAGFEVASRDVAHPVQALGWSRGFAWVAGGGNLTAYSVDLDPLGRFPYSGPATTFRFHEGLVLLGDVAVDGSTPAAMAPAEPPRVPFFATEGGDLVRLDSDGEAQCRLATGLAQVDVLASSQGAMVAAGSGEVVAVRAAGPEPLLAAPRAILDMAVG
jgi:hypothetical protein